MPNDFVKNHKAYFINPKHSTLAPDQNAKKIEEDFNKAKDKIRQNLIASDTSKDNSVIYTAITQFKKING